MRLQYEKNKSRFESVKLQLEKHFRDTAHRLGDWLSLCPPEPIALRVRRRDLRR